MKSQSCAAFFAFSLASAGLADLPKMMVDLTPITGILPSELNESGAVAGHAVGGYLAARWTEAAGVEVVHPPGNILGSWIKDFNDSGEVAGDGCIPPPGGNGPCGLYLFRNTPGVGNLHLDVSQAGITGAMFAWPMKISNSGAVAVGLWIDVMQGSGRHVLFFSDELGWVNLTTLVSEEQTPYVRLLDMNHNDQVLLESGWSSPIYRWSPQTGLELLFPSATTSVVDMNNHGQVAGNQPFASGSSIFRYTDGVGIEQLDPTGAFPNAYAEMINDAGMVLGHWEGGIFLFADGAGMQDLGFSDFVSIAGLNSRGDVTAAEHDQQTYAGTPKIKLFGEPVRDAQEMIDPAETLILIDQIGPINDQRRFTVTGRDPQQPGVTLAFLAQARCSADYNADGDATVPDIFAFLADWFAGVEKANVNRDGDMSVADIFAFLSAWFAGC